MNEYPVEDSELKDSIDPKYWTHPQSLLAVMLTNNERGRRFEKIVGRRMRGHHYPDWGVDYRKELKHHKANCKPDILFQSPQSNETKYVEIKSVQEKRDKKTRKINYKITRLNIYDGADGSYGIPCFDYLVIAFIHPSKGIIFRSMTHGQCEKAIDLGAAKWNSTWKAWSFDIDDVENLTHTKLDMYNYLECIDKYEGNQIVKKYENNFQLLFDFSDTYSKIKA